MQVSYAGHLAQVAGGLLTGRPLSYSPMCLCLAVFLLLSSVAEHDRVEIMKGLQITGFSDEAAAAAMQALRAAGSLELGVNVFSRGLKLTEAYRTTLQRIYNTIPEELKSVGQVNAWASTATHGMISEILQSIDGVDAVLLSALYFKAEWQDKFEHNNTRPAAFTRLDGSEVQTLTMHKTGRMLYKKYAGAEVLQLPFKNTTIRGMIILPTERGDAALRGALTEEHLAVVNTRQSKVELALPKFKAESTLDLVGFLRSLGITTMFGGLDTTASFGEMLKVTGVVQKAIVDLDEEGVKAAAVTAITMRCTSTGFIEEMIHFHCDRPFWFALMLDSTVLFVSAVTDFAGTH